MKLWWASLLLVAAVGPPGSETEKPRERAAYELHCKDGLVLIISPVTQQNLAEIKKIANCLSTTNQYDVCTFHVVRLKLSN